MPQLLQEWVSAHARQHPDDVAIVYRGATTTYAQLDEESNRLARALRRAGCQKGDRIGLLLERSDKAIQGLLATLKADCSYVPLDLRSPVERIARALKVCTPRLLLADDTASARLTALCAADAQLPDKVAWLGSTSAPDRVRKPLLTQENWAGDSAEPLDYRNAPSDLAYLMFTALSDSPGTEVTGR